MRMAKDELKSILKYFEQYFKNFDIRLQSLENKLDKVQTSIDHLIEKCKEFEKFRYKK